MSHSNPLISSILIAPTATASALQVGYIINGIGIPVDSKVLSINSIGGGQWEITINKTPTSADAYTIGSHGPYSDPSGANDGTIQWSTNLTITGVPLSPDSMSTLSFKEDVKGWVSFKSFTPENAISMANDYYTFLNGKIYQHHVESSDRNTFYEDQLPVGLAFTSSTVDVILNDQPSIIKEFNTLNYEGSQSKVNHFISKTLSLYAQPTTTYNDQEYYNLSSKLGWHVQSIITNEEDGRVDEFLEKEGKWFNYIKREIDRGLLTADTGDFSFQGIGFSTAYTTQSWNCVANEQGRPSSCIDPGTGQGMYLTLSECENVCSPTPPSPSWDCALIYEGDVDIYGCVDPGTGNGQYSTLSACEEACDDGLGETIICDTCQDGYPVSTVFAGSTCPRGTIPTGTGDPCEDGDTIICDTCQDGYPISNVFVGGVCPRDWIPTGTGNPCDISCDTCQDGYPISNIFTASDCPRGWIPTGSGNPCEVTCDSCWNGYPISQTFNGGSCPNGWIPTGTTNPCEENTIICDACVNGAPVSNIFSGDSCPNGWVPAGSLGPCEESGNTVVCDSCQDGYPVSNVFNGSVCPEGSIPTGTGNPCEVSSSTVTCDTCQDGYPVSQIFSGDTCPQGWTPTGSGNPCTVVTCDACQDGYPVSYMFNNSCPKGWVPTGTLGPCNSPHLPPLWICGAIGGVGTNNCTEVLSSDPTYSSLVIGSNAWTSEYQCNTFCQVPGCTDPTALNYYAGATVDDGSCFYPAGCIDCALPGADTTVPGCCTQFGTVNYNPLATCLDSSCIMIVYGCTDPTAINYYPGAGVDDGTCAYVAGCMDILATNYDPLADFDDGSCTYPLPSSDCYACQNNQFITHIWPGYSCPSGWAPNPNTIQWPNSGWNTINPCVVSGCTDSNATNYNASATIDDGSCDYVISLSGCTNPLANNYNPAATSDDGSCTFDEDNPTPPPTSKRGNNNNNYQT